MWKTLGLEACLDPLHSVAGRPVVSGKNAVYEAVNKPSRSKFFVGMHNEMVGKRTVRRAAFVCFKQAEKGGEFLVADGRRILRFASSSKPRSGFRVLGFVADGNTFRVKGFRVCR